jgi:hypothetical protein
LFVSLVLVVFVWGVLMLFCIVFSCDDGPGNSIQNITTPPKQNKKIQKIQKTKTGAPLASEARRRLFMADRHRRGRAFTTDHIWTFSIWQQVIDVPGYYLDLVVQHYDIIQHLDGQPLQCMVKDKAGGGYLFHLVYWHKRQMAERARQLELDAAAAAAAAAGKQQQQQQRLDGGGGSGGGGAAAAEDKEG